jgi:putative transposase
MAVDILLLLTWKTHANLPLLDASSADHVAGLLPLLARKARADILELALVPTHVHAIVECDARVDVPRLMQYLKGASARLVNGEASGTARAHLRWSEGYDARSVGRRDLYVLRRYLDGQGERHRTPLLVRWSAQERVSSPIPLSTPTLPVTG